MKKSFFCLFTVLFIGLSGCSNTNTETVNSANALDEKYISQHDQLIMLTKRLADQLYLNVEPNKQAANIAVGTFTDLTTLQGSQESLALKTLGLQLEDGLMTESVQRGFKVIEYRLRQNLTITKDANLMLSRELKFINEHQNINYFLTGTIALRDENILINARLVNVKSKEIVAAATSALTSKELGLPNNITLRAGKIYRTSKNPNRGSK
ncbi:MAG: FlgO family outer membrane protein [Colwellia sp.]|nr:FlgO family outer membrane protein [Colwellia sp.]